MAEPTRQERLAEIGRLTAAGDSEGAQAQVREFLERFAAGNDMYTLMREVNDAMRQDGKGHDPAKPIRIEPAPEPEREPLPPAEPEAAPRFWLWYSLVLVAGAIAYYLFIG